MRHPERKKWLLEDKYGVNVTGDLDFQFVAAGSTAASGVRILA